MESGATCLRVKILICSYAFHPSVGGIESVSAALADEFLRMGHDVRVVTETVGDGTEPHAYPVLRHPSAFTLWSCYRWADVVWHNNLSLRLLWPRFFSATRCFVTTQTWLSGTLGLETPASRVKRWVLRCCRNISISQTIASHLQTPSVVLGNPYRSEVYYADPTIPRELKLVFVGRLVSDKGLLLLLQALVRLRSLDLSPALTVVGSGPERAACEALVKDSDLSRQVNFLGPLSGKPLREILHAHEILVIPSRWAEPFGVVALEGIACGCVVLGTQDGGLPEAIGPCGIVCENNHVEALAEALRDLLTSSELREKLRAAASRHLPHYTASHLASRYLELFAVPSTQPAQPVSIYPSK